MWHTGSVGNLGLGDTWGISPNFEVLEQCTSGPGVMMECPTALGGQVGAQVAMLSGRSCIRPSGEGDLEVEMNSVVLRGPEASRRSAFSRPEPRPDVLTRPQRFFPQGQADLRYSSTVAPRAKPGMCLPALALPACPLHRLGD